MKKIWMVMLIVLAGLVAMAGTVVVEDFSGATLGVGHGISYVSTPTGQGAVFDAEEESRIQYPYDDLMNREGTLEWIVKIDRGYSYNNSNFSYTDSTALLFTTDIWSGDVTWPGSAWFRLYANGKVVFHLAGVKYSAGHDAKYKLTANNTSFRFGEWHKVGISFGSQGAYVMVDGMVVASDPTLTQTLGAGGTHSQPMDIPTLGESVSSFWANNRYEGGFEGVVDWFRISDEQQDWTLSSMSSLIVLQGLGDGSYTNGHPVAISADAPASGYEFSHWTADSGEYTNNLSDASAASTTFTMPATNVTLVANYILLDSDSDGMDDAWELQYFQTLEETADGDFDADGRTNGEEETDGTDPTDAGSTLGLVAYYPFDGDANDVSGNGHDGTEYGGVGYVADAMKGNSVGFVGNTSVYIAVPHHGDLNFPGSFSVSYWTKHDLLTGNRYTISKGKDTSSGYGMQSGGKHFWLYAGGARTYCSLPDEALTVGEWNHSLFVVDTVQMRIYGYANGELESETVIAGGLSPSSTYNLHFGKHFSGYYPYDGLLDDVRFYNRTLSSNEVALLYSGVVTTNPPTTEYALTVSQGSGDGSFTNGHPVSVSADVPASGYEFSHWTVAPTQYTNNLSDAGAASTTFTMPATNVTLTANYALLPTYTISTTAGAHGSISPVNPSVVRGADQAFSISPDTGYHVESLSVDGSPVSKASSYTFNDVQSAHSIAATFAINMYRVEFDLNGGSRSGGGELVQWVPHGGTAIAPIVTPPAGYGKLEWSGALGPITSSRTISAQYEQTGSSWHTVTFREGLHGSRTGGGELSQQVLHAHPAVAPEMVADTGWDFAGWSASFDAVLANLQVVAAYTRDPAYKQLSVVSAHGSPSVSGSAMYTNGAAVSVSMDSMVLSNSSSIYTCTGWSASDGSNGSDASAALTLDEDVTLTWNWTSQFYLSVSEVGAGSVDVASGFQPAQSTVELTAVPDSGKEFQGWGGAASGMNPVASVTMDRAKNVTATFGEHLVEATIDSLSPARLTLGTAVSFVGSAEASGGATIEQYRWRMVELVGGVESGPVVELSSQPSFIRNDLSAGHWRVYFDAKDSTGAWAVAAMREIRVENPVFLTDLSVARADMRFLAADGSELDPMMANQVRLGAAVTVEITVRNLGGVAVTNPVVVSLCDGIGPMDFTAYTPVPNLLATNQIASIPAGGASTVSMEWQVGYDIAGQAIFGYDGSFRLLSAWAEHAVNHAEALDGDSEELPIYEASLDNNKGQATILIGEVPLDDYEMVATVNDATVDEDQELFISGSADYKWLNHESAVIGALVQITVDGSAYSASTDVKGRFSVNAGYWAHGTYVVSVEVNDGTMVASDTATATVRELTVPPPAKPDLKVTAVQVAGEGMYETESSMPHALVGSNVTVSATIKNDGTLTAAQPFTVRFSVDGSGEVIGTATVTNSISTGVSRSVTCPAVWSTNQVGTYSIRATVDADGQVDERNEGNNARTLAIAVHEARPDLRPYYISGQVVHTLSVSPANPVQGETLTLGVDVFNAGPVAMSAETFGVRFLIGGEMVGETNGLAALSSGGSVRVELPWDTTTVQPGYQTLVAVVDFDDDVVEDFENNNTAQTTFDLLPAVPALILEPTASETDWYRRTAYLQTGQSLTLPARVKNVGGADYLGGSFLRLSEGTLANMMLADSVPPMGVDRTREMSMSWTAPDSPTNLVLFVHVDGSVISKSVHVYEYVPGNPAPAAPPIADPGVLGSDISIPGEWTRGDLVSAAATIRNYGTLPATNVLAQFYYSVDSVGYTPLGTSQLIGVLPVGGATNLLSTGTLEAVEPYYTIKVRLTPSGGNDRTYNDVATRSFAIEAPWAEAGDNQVSVVGRTVTLDGRESQHHTAYDWRFSSMPIGSVATLSGANSAQPTFIPDVPGSYEVQLQVSDDDGLYSPYAWVSVLANAQLGTTLTVESAHGVPIPSIGTHAVMIGSTNAVSVDSVTIGGTNWNCIGWSGTGILPMSGTTNSTDVVVVDEFPILTWLWETNVLLTVETSGDGDISGAIGWVSVGTTQTVTAVASNGFTFSEWIGDLDGCVLDGATTELVMDRSRSLIAQFLPVPVSDFAAQVGGIDRVQLTWNYAGLSSALFRVEKLPGGETVWQTLATQSARSFLDDSVSEGESLFYRVSAVVDGLASEPIQVHVEVPYLPDAPSGLRVESVSFTDVALGWQPAARATRYAVQRRSLPLGEWAFVAQSSSTAWVDSSVTEGARYAYRVRSVNEAGNSGFSAVVEMSIPVDSSEWTYGMQITNEVVSSNILCGAEISATFDLLLSNPEDTPVQHRVVAGLRDTNGFAVGSAVEIAEAVGVPVFPPEWLTNVVLPRGLRQPVDAGIYSLWVEDVLDGADPRETFASAVRTNESTLARRLALYDVREPQEGDAFVQAGLSSGFAGETIAVPITVGAIGGENAFSFSLAYDDTKLEFIELEPIDGMQGCYLKMNEDTAGEIGALMLLPLGVGLAPEVQDIAVARFRISESLGAGTSVSIAFGDTPSFRMVTDPYANMLPHVWYDGDVSVVSVGYEADVSPRGQPDGQLRAQDRMQIMRFAVGLDVPTLGTEYQRADCAPIDTRGDGQIDIRDAVIANRYVGGAESLKDVGGPSAPVVRMTAFAEPMAFGDPMIMASSGEAGLLELDASSGMRGEILDVPVKLLSGGNIEAISFSVSFDPDELAFLSADPASVSSNAISIFNREDSAEGRVSYAVRMPEGSPFPSGSIPVVTLRFRVVNAASDSVTRLDITSNPSPLMLSDGEGESVAAHSQGASVYLMPASATGQPESVEDLLATLDGTRVQLSWTDATHETGYLVYRRSQTDGWSLLAEIPADLEQYADDGLQPGETYSYRLGAANAVGESSSDPVEIQVPTKYRLWADVQIGENQGEPDEDSDGDGLPNHLEYLMNTDPSVSNRGQLRTAKEDLYGLGDSYFTLSVDLDAARQSGSVLADTTDDLINGVWQSAPEVECVETNGMRSFKFRTKKPMNQSTSQFLRLKTVE